MADHFEAIKNFHFTSHLRTGHEETKETLNNESLIGKLRELSLSMTGNVVEAIH